jgi:hypothetical protein
MNLKAFQEIRCEDCGSKEHLMQHVYNDRVKCESCLNFLLDSASALEEFNQGSLNDLHQERAQ